MGEELKDTYLTITNPAEGEYTEKRSKFLSFAFHVETIDEVKALVDEYKKIFTTHVTLAMPICWAASVTFFVLWTTENRPALRANPSLGK